MNKTINNTNPVKEEKKTTETAQLSNPIAPEPNKVLNEEKLNEEKIEEASTESLKALQKEVAEKEQQINQQLEILWARGTSQMLGDQIKQASLPNEEQQKPSPLQIIDPPEESTHTDASNTEHHDLTIVQQKQITHPIQDKDKD